MNLNVLVHPSTIILVKDGQNLQPHPPEKVHDIVLNNKKVKVSEIAEVVNFLPYQSFKRRQLNLNMVKHPSTIDLFKTIKNCNRTGKRHDIVLDDRRVKVSEIAEAVGILEERVRDNLHKGLGNPKLCAKLVPHLLNAYKK